MSDEFDSDESRRAAEELLSRALELATEVRRTRDVVDGALTRQGGLIVNLSTRIAVQQAMLHALFAHVFAGERTAFETFMQEIRGRPFVRMQTATDREGQDAVERLERAYFDYFIDSTRALIKDTDAWREHLRKITKENKDG